MPALFVFAAGYGTRVSTLALVTHWTGSAVRARVFGLVQIVENIGKLAAEPIMLRIFAASLPLGGPWLAMPFYVSAVRLHLLNLVLPPYQRRYCLYLTVRFLFGSHLLDIHKIR